eukprot:2477996-Prymnesium_polylepis.1
MHDAWGVGHATGLWVRVDIGRACCFDWPEGGDCCGSASWTSLASKPGTYAGRGSADCRERMNGEECSAERAPDVVSHAFALQQH